MKFHHIGYLTNSLKTSTSNFNMLSYKKIGKPIIDNSLKVKIQFLKNRNNIIELIKPNLNNYGLINILKKKNYAYHFAYKVDHLEKTIFELKKKFKIIVNPTSAKAFYNKKVAFLTMSDGFIIELIQS